MASFRVSSFLRPLSRQTPITAQSLTSTCFRKSSTVVAPASENLFPLAAKPPKAVLAQLHKFPFLEPVGYTSLPTEFVNLPIRKDILWRAVTFDTDALNLRKHLFVPNRKELGYSKAKMTPQKGRGRARLGKNGSPMLHTGSTPFGPRNPDTRTELNRRIYNVALRTALSYFYQKSKLTLLDGSAELPTSNSQAAREIITAHQWQNSKVLIVVADERAQLKSAFAPLPEKIAIVDVRDIDVKSLLRADDIVIEREALQFFQERTEGKEYLRPEESSNKQNIVKQVEQRKRAAREQKLF
ncbi:ribosomal protein L4 domain-containing protein [Lipomyces japonicus]|uniref:mitochondrial 54S ribosomal protein uL4m n=1 Tax=Lipomyces japonicus TaxID=56871 RepID=UPI0034CE82FD